MIIALYKSTFTIPYHFNVRSKADISQLNLTHEGGTKKRGHRLMTIVLSNPHRLNIFFAGRFMNTLADKRISKVPPHLAYVATLLWKH